MCIGISGGFFRYFKSLKAVVVDYCRIHIILYLNHIQIRRYPPPAIVSRGIADFLNEGSLTPIVFL